MVMPLWSLGLARAGYWASDDAGHLAMTFRRGMEAYSRGDYEAALAPFDPAIEWTVDASLVLEATTDHGHAGVKRLWQTWAEAISGMALEIEECRCIEQNRVLAITRAHGAGAGRVRLYGDVARALAAVGLRE
jgi:ketosteroid isomerase-like protein